MALRQPVPLGAANYIGPEWGKGKATRACPPSLCQDHDIDRFADATDLSGRKALAWQWCDITLLLGQPVGAGIGQSPCFLVFIVLFELGGEIYSIADHREFQALAVAHGAEDDATGRH